MLLYTLSLQSRRQHLWSVTLTFTQTELVPVELSLPNWTPGSYLIRDYAKHLVGISATADGKELPLVQQNKNSWKSEKTQGKIVVTYRLFGLDPSIRSSYLDNDHGFFDGAALFLAVKNHTHEEHQLHILDLPSSWDVATGMPRLQDGLYAAPDYAAFIDYPVELGKFTTLDFKASGIPHQIVLSGHYQGFDEERLRTDIAKICTSAIGFFGAAPFSEYTFLLRVREGAYGGLEHRNSSALLISPECLPERDPEGQERKDYINLLGLFSHEYFHAWNIKSIKPKVFQPYDLNHEVYTEWLWFFEGVTSFYDDWLLAKSEVISPREYLTLLAGTINQVLGQPGEKQQSVTNVSFNAWTKYYQADENSKNATVSYYKKGSLVALCLDFFLRKESGGAFSLHHFLRALYQRYNENGEGLREGSFPALIQEFSSIDVGSFTERYITGVDPLPLKEALAAIGIAYADIASITRDYVVENFPKEKKELEFGAEWTEGATGLTLKQVKNGSNAEIAGLNPRDIIVAVNGVAAKRFPFVWRHCRAGEEVTIHFFREDYLHTTKWQAVPLYVRHGYVQITDPALFSGWLLNDAAG